MILNKEKFNQNELPIENWQKSQAIDILEEYYCRVDGIVQNLATIDAAEYLDGHLLASYLLAIGEGYDFFENKKHWLKNAYNILVYFKQNIEQYFNLALFNGLTDFAFAILDIRIKFGEFEKFLKSLNKAICDMLLERLVQFENEGTIVHHYDVISGMAGVGRYLLLYIEYFEDKEDCLQEKKALEQILKYYVKLSTDINVKNKKIIGFYITNENLWPEERRTQYLYGTLDFGVAHGIAGPLAIMAYATENNIVVDGQSQAIDNIISVYNQHAEIDKGIIYWPFILPFEQYKQPDTALKNTRMAWCYGSLGVSCVLYQSSKRLGLPISEHIRNIEKIAQSSKEIFGLISPIICHGYAGALAMLNIVYRELLDKDLLPGLYMCLNEILSLHNPNFPYGFKNIDYGVDGRYEKEDDTYLNGSTGIILALLSLFNPNSLHEKHLLIS